MSIVLINPHNQQILKQTKDGWSDSAGNTFPIVNQIGRFVSSDNYTSNFGFQWNKFADTQVDRFHRGLSQSSERFFAVTNWRKEDLTGKKILEVGSGAGRFSQIILSQTNADLYSVDYSNAVDANFANNGPHQRLKLFQASIYEMPFAPGQFDKVICFGVLQHTPNVKQSVKCLVNAVKPGGELIVDFYPIRGWYTKVHAKYIFRPFTRRMDHRKLLSKIENNADRLIALYNFFDKIKLGKIVNRFLPICDIKNTLPIGLSKAALREWVILDTFDMFSPAYDQPQRLTTVINWFKEFGLRDVMGHTVRFGNNSVTVVKGKK
jgi:2-polyprenyl-3-methyl-5-hydroxy-6-metoxy-1,4-benzoquinol methylase